MHYEFMKTLDFMDTCAYHQNATRNWQVGVLGLLPKRIKL